MIISTGRKYVFVHVPKTGGTSLALALEGRAMRDDILIGDTPKAQRRKHRLKALMSRGPLRKHATLADIEGVVSAAQMSQMFVFTLVRNPWDRVVSYYHWLLQQSFDHPAVGCAKSHDFAGFVGDEMIQQSLVSQPYGHYVQDAAGQERCSAFIRLECFQQDAAPLYNHLGFSFELPLENASRREARYAKYYSPVSRDIISDVCADDIARFGYRFEA